MLGLVSDRIKDKIYFKEYGCICGTSTTDVLVEMVHYWYKATDKPGNVVRVLLFDYSKAFDHINHHTLIQKLINIGLELPYCTLNGSFPCEQSSAGETLEQLHQVSVTQMAVFPKGHYWGPKTSWYSLMTYPHLVRSTSTWMTVQ